jgi:hypothetical protein
MLALLRDNRYYVVILLIYDPAIYPVPVWLIISCYAYIGQLCRFSGAF